MSSNLSLDWVKHLPDDESKKDFEQLVRNTTQVLSRLRSIIEEKEKLLSQSELSMSDFDTPNWAYKQSFRNGKLASLKDIKNLTDFIA